MIAVTEGEREWAHSGTRMDSLQEFQAVARKRGFVDVKECDDGTVLWLSRKTPDAATQTPQRICMDSLTNSVTVYWRTTLGKLDSKTFRSVSSLQEWFELHLAK